GVARRLDRDPDGHVVGVEAERGERAPGAGGDAVRFRAGFAHHPEDLPFFVDEDAGYLLEGLEVRTENLARAGRGDAAWEHGSGILSGAWTGGRGGAPSAGAPDQKYPGAGGGCQQQRRG